MPFHLDSPILTIFPPIVVLSLHTHPWLICVRVCGTIWIITGLSLNVSARIFLRTRTFFSMIATQASHSSKWALIQQNDLINHSFDTWSSYLQNILFSFFKVLLSLLQYCSCFMFWFFGRQACGISAPRPGMEPAPPALEGEVLTTGPPGKSPKYSFLYIEYFTYLYWFFSFSFVFLEFIFP